MNKIDKQPENTNLKIWLYSLWSIATICLLLAILNYPKQGNIAQVNREISQTKQDIKTLSAKTTNNSPLSAKEKDFSLPSAEKKANDNLVKGVSTIFGGLKTPKEYAQNTPMLNKLVGKKFTKFFALTDSEEGVQYIKNNETHAYFGKVDDIHHAPIFVYTEYQSKAFGKTMTNSTSFYFDYDLTNQKVNSYKQKTFVSNNNN